jgi:hypothetical protein
MHGLANHGMGHIVKFERLKLLSVEQYMHDQSIVDIDPKAELLLVRHLHRVDFLEALYQRPALQQTSAAP